MAPMGQGSEVPCVTSHHHLEESGPSGGLYVVIPLNKGNAPLFYAGGGEALFDNHSIDVGYVL
jgi:hypothetical protein